MALNLVAPPASADLPPLAPPVRIVINSPGLVGLAPIYLADEKGYFKAEGLDVQIADGVAKGGGMEIVQALTDGKLDVATIAPSAGLFKAIADGARITGLLVLNTVTASDTSSGILVRQDLIASGRYKLLHDLRGMKIAVGAIGSSSHYNVVKALRGAGLSAGDVQFVAMSFPAALQALRDSSVDAAFEVEPFISASEAGGVARLVAPSSETSPGAASVLVCANADFIARNKDAVERYVYAVMRGQRDYNAALTTGAGRDELYAAVMKHTALKDIEQIKRLRFPTVDPDGALDVRAMDDLQAFFVANGGLAKALTAEQIVDSHFANVALRRLDKVR